MAMSEPRFRELTAEEIGPAIVADMAAEKPPLPFKAKLLNVMAKVGYVQKRGLNKHFNYKYATEADIAEKVREALIEERLLFVPSVTSCVQRGNVTEIMLQAQLCDVDSQESLIWHMPGAGQDPGDKGPYKAVTGAEKYALMKLLLIPTGDDPEADDKTDKATAGNGTTVPTSEPEVTVVKVIDPDQYDTLTNLLAEAEADTPAFLRFFSIEALGDMPQAEFQRACAALRGKIGANARAKEKKGKGAKA